MTKLLEPDVIRNMSAIERSEAQLRVAMQSPQKLKQWIEATGRTWMVFNAIDLVDALPWPPPGAKEPVGIDYLMMIIQCYRDHRAAMETGDFETIKNPNGVEHKVAIMKGELLELPELDRAIRFLIGQATEKDPAWTLNNPPM